MRIPAGGGTLRSIMSRGPGKIEQAIIDAVAREPGALIPVWEIAAEHGYDVTVRNAMHSWRRGAHNLAAQGLIEEHWVWPSGYANTQMMCVSTPDCDADVDDDAVRQRCGEVASSRNAKRQASRTEAQFVLDMLDTGRWTVADRKTGKLVDHHAAWLKTRN
jgi:hypothetical protein